MNCIDGIEGVAKKVIESIHRMHRENRTDDSEFAQSVKAVIAGTNAFVMENREVIHDPELLTRELYNFSKMLWLETRQQEDIPEEADADEDADFFGYYFDRIYNRQDYPA